MEPREIRHRIARWELMRLPFNGVCLLGAWLAWNLSNQVAVAIDEMPPSSLHDAGALRDFVFGFSVLNIAYCLIYAVEFVAIAMSMSAARALNICAYAFGCILGFVIASRGSGGIAQAIVSEKRIESDRKARLEDVRQRLEEETRLRNDALAKERPNKALEPTPTSVTSPAAQEPRQP